MRTILETILNVNLDETQWIQASLPVRQGGLGIRRLSEVSLPAFLASSHGVVNSVTKLLSINGDTLILPHVDEALAAWLAKCPNSSIPEQLEVQRLWDDKRSQILLQELENQSDGANLARIKASAALKQHPFVWSDQT